MQTNYLFQSNRLGFRNWKIGDHEPFADLNNDPEVMAFLPKGLCVEESSEMISRMENTHNDLGFTFFAVDLLETNEFIVSGLSFYRVYLFIPHPLLLFNTLLFIIPFNKFFSLTIQ
mgnify:CR=1 FL=1